MTNDPHSVTPRSPKVLKAHIPYVSIRMATVGGARVSKAVQAVHAVTGEVRVFRSLRAAADFFNVNDSTVKRRIDRNLQVDDYLVTYAEEGAVPTPVQTPVVAATPIVQDVVAVQQGIEGAIITQAPLEFLMGDVNGHNMRITDETPRWVSVYDLIARMTGSKNPHLVFRRLAEEHTEISACCSNLQFHGAGQRATPVCDVRGAVRIMMLLPGRAAARFRENTGEYLIRILGGDETLVAEIRANAAVQQTLPDDHPMRVFGEAVEADNRYRFISPSMEGKTLYDFKDARALYLIIFTINGVTYIKFGKTESSLLRMETHLKDYPNAEIYYMGIANNIKRVEDEFKLKLKYSGNLTNLVVNNQHVTEIIKDLTPEKAEEMLVKVTTDVDNGDYVQLRLAEINKGVETQRLSVENKRLECENKRLECEQEARRVELNKARLEMTKKLIETSSTEVINQNFEKILNAIMGSLGGQAPKGADPC